MESPTFNRPGASSRRIIQIHPALRCNLACRHCYSESDPAASLAIEPGLLRDALSDAAGMGYESVSVSGGEPLLYAALPGVLRHARSLGMRTSVTTNGTLLHVQRLEPLRGLVDVLAISVDGPPEIHDEIRARAGAFDQMLRGLDVVREMGFTFGFIHTLTNTSWEHLIWLAEFAAEHGAKLLQIHPCENTGRAMTEMTDRFPTGETLARAFLLLQALGAKYAGRFVVQFDALHPAHARADRSLVLADEMAENLTSALPADLVAPLIVEADGAVVPISYGFARRFQIADLQRERLAHAWPRFLEERFAALHGMCVQFCDEMLNANPPELFNWYEMIVNRSHNFPAVPVQMLTASGPSWVY